MTEQDQLAIILKESGIEQTQAEPLINKFGTFYTDAIKITAQSKGIVIKDISQIDEMKKSREFRLSLKRIRTDADKIRVEMKEPFLRGANAVQLAYNGIEKITREEERRLEEQEKFVEKIEAEKKRRIEVERINQLLKFDDQAENYSVHPDLMSEETFNKLFENAKLAFEARKKAEEEAKKQKLADEKAEFERQEAIRIENEKLKAEAEKRDKELAIEREKVRKENEARETELAKERAEQQKKFEAEQKKQIALQNELRLQKEAEAKKESERLAKIEADKKAIEEASRKKLLAPDKEKLLELASMFDSLQLPAVSSKEAMSVIRATEDMISKVSNYIREKAKTL